MNEPGAAFAAGAVAYAQEARLQQVVAWRLAHYCRDLPLGSGPVLDLGAGNGSLSLALCQQRSDVQPLLIDYCAELLCLSPTSEQQRLLWDLNNGLPSDLPPAALVMSSFALQWLDEPLKQLRHWRQRLAPNGWLAIAVPVAGSLQGWQQASQIAGVPCSALPLPAAAELRHTLAEHAQLQIQRSLHYSQSFSSPLAFLRQLQRLGLAGTTAARLSPGQGRRLLQAWPRNKDCTITLNWNMELLLARAA
jgi:malonyl-CoA O-methyltransferase